MARSGKTAEAIEAARKSLNESPDDAEALNQLKEVCEIAKQPERFDAELVALAQQAKSPEMRKRLAKMLMDRHKTAEATAVFTRLVEDQPDDADAAYLLAGLQIKQKNMEGALERIAKAVLAHPATYNSATSMVLSDIILADLRLLVQKHPDDAALHYLLGVGLLWQREYEAADQAAQDSLRLNEKFGPAHLLRAEAAAMDKRWEDAVKAAQAAIDNGISDAHVYLIKGIALEALDKFQDAETALLESFRLDRKSAEPLFILAQSAERRGELLRAEQVYRRILDDVDPKHARARERLVRMLLNTRKSVKAKEYYSDFERLGQLEPEVERSRALMDLADSRAPAGQERLDAYRTALDAIIKKYPKDPATYIERAMSFEAVGDYESAQKDADAALAIEPDNFDALKRKAAYQVKQLDFEGAAKTATALLKLRPRDPGFLQSLADSALALGDFDTAARRLKELIARDDLKEARDAFVGRLLKVLKTAKRSAEAAEVAKNWLDLAPTDAPRRAVYLVTLRDAKRFDEAVDLAKQWLSMDPTNDDLRSQYISQLIAAKRYVEGQQRVLSWLASEADDLTLNGLLISLCQAAKEWDNAIDLARTGAEISEQRPAYEQVLASTYLLARRFDDAIEFFRERTGDPKNFDATAGLIESLASAERFQEAEDVASSALAAVQADREDPEGQKFGKILTLRNYLVRIYQPMGRESQAAQLLEEMLRMLPPGSADPQAGRIYFQYVGIQNDLGYTWADAGTRLDEAEKMIRYAVGERPTTGAYLDSLGWVLYKRGRFDEAIVYLRRAILLMEREDATLYDHLADALYRTKQVDEAKKNWEKALAVHPPDDDTPPSAEDRRILARIKDKLEQLEQKKEVPVASLAKNEPSTRPARPPVGVPITKPAQPPKPPKRHEPVSPRE
jgi:tetratricopeptide (TPR) repeat protein